MACIMSEYSRQCAGAGPGENVSMQVKSANIFSIARTLDTHISVQTGEVMTVCSSYVTSEVMITCISLVTGEVMTVVFVCEWGGHNSMQFSCDR